MRVRLEKVLREFIIPRGKIKVNWDGIYRLERTKEQDSGRESTFVPLNENLIDYLLQRRYFTYGRGFVVVDNSGVNLNPTKGSPHSIPSFRREEDARDYQRSDYCANQSQGTRIILA